MDMIKTNILYNVNVDDSKLAFAVIAARCQNKWIFCRHLNRTTWEIPGGHREQDESIEETAKRELWEETGAAEYTLQQLFPYSVDRDGSISYGMVFYAEVTALREIPAHSEIECIQLVEAPPEELTYPQIQPEIYRHVQNWMNMRSSLGEPWDVYDGKRNLLGRIHRRGDPLPEGEYHLAVHVWVCNAKGQFLLTQRSPNKGYPLLWECSGGSALAGDDSLTAALREVREETGLTLNAHNGLCLFSDLVDDCIRDVWLFRQEVDLDDIVLLEGETCDAKLVTVDELLRLRRDGRLCPFDYLDKLLVYI